MRVNSQWSKESISWIEGDIRYISVVFTWDLPKIKRQLGWQKTIIGGPATMLMPDYFDGIKNVEVKRHMPGMLQLHNPNATRTSIGCIRKCDFCAVPHTEGKLLEFKDWPDKPTIIDNNLLATSQKHFDKVIDRLKKHRQVDLNQGLDARLLSKYHARRLSEIKSLRRSGIRLALDDMKHQDVWSQALNRLRSAGIAKSNISSYALIGFISDPHEAWERCNWIESQGVRVLPMWFHELDALQKNTVTAEQQIFGWNDYERKKIMQWFYHHKKAVK